jgi:hypothetical protein
MTVAVDRYPGYRCVEFVFDEHPKSGKTTDLVRSLKQSSLGFAQRIGGMTTVPSKDYAAIQTADLLGFESRLEFAQKGFKQRSRSNKNQESLSFRALMSGPNVTVKYFDDQTIRRAVLKALQADSERRAKASKPQARSHP